MSALSMVTGANGHLGNNLVRQLLGRGQAVRAMGERAYRGLFSLVSAVALGWLIYAYAEAPYEELWPQAPWSRWLPLLAMPFALFFLVCALTSRNPSMAGMEKSVDAQYPITGVLTITRHPLLWSFALWGLAHVPPNGDRAARLRAYWARRRLCHSAEVFRQSWA